jgi:ribosome-binding ATPase YchF (GTP1/OBG family)
MMLSDLEYIQKRLEKNNKKNVEEEQLKILEIALDCINNDKDISVLKDNFDNKQLNQTGLLIVKPKIFVCNVDEQSVQNGNDYTKDFIEKFGHENTLVVSADIENQINELEEGEKKNYMEMIGLKKTGLNMLIQKGYKILELDTYFTSGPEETRAWTIQKNCTAPKAAGEIHSDFEKGFIRAETISYDDFVANEGWINSKTSGKMRLEGKDYIVKDGDVLNFRFNT